MVNNTKNLTLSSVKVTPVYTAANPHPSAYESVIPTMTHSLIFSFFVFNFENLVLYTSFCRSGLQVVTHLFKWPVGQKELTTLAYPFTYRSHCSRRQS